LIQTASNAFQQATVSQTITVINRPGGIIECGDSINFTQTINGAFNLKSEIDSKTIADIRNSVQTAFENSVTQTNKEIIEFLAKEPSGDNFNKITNIIRTKISKEFTNSIILNITSRYSFSQNMSIDNYSIIRGNKCNFDQNIIVRAFASALLNEVSNLSFNDTVVNKAVNDVVQHLQTESKGLNSILWPIAIIAIIVGILVIIGVIIYFVFTRKRTELALQPVSSKL
jgi:hypothetical protein